MKTSQSLFRQFINRDRSIDSFDLVTILSVFCLLKQRNISVPSEFWGPRFYELINQLDKTETTENINTLREVWSVLSKSLIWQHDPNLLGAISCYFDDNNEFNYGHLVDELFLDYEKSSGKYRGESIQSSEVTNLVLQLCNSLPTDKVYNPFAGMASYITESGIKDFYAQEALQNIWALSVIRLLVHGLSPINFKCENSISAWNSFGQKFDLIITTPPFGLRIDSDITTVKSIEEFVIYKGLKDLTANGKLAIILPTRFLTQSGGIADLRKMLIDSDLLEYIVLFPGNLFFNTSIPTCLVILNKNKLKSGEVTLVDAKYYVNSVDKTLHLNNELLFKDIESVNPQSIRIIENAVFISNDFDFNLNRYFSNTNKLEVPDGYRVVKLGEILKSLNCSRAKETSGRLLKVSNLSNDSFAFHVNPLQLDVVDLNRNFNKLETPAIVLSRRFNRLKPSYCLASKELPVYLIPEIDALILSDSNIDLSYLIYQLNSEYVQIQIENYSFGVMPSIKKEDLMNIEILLPDYTIQKQLIEEAKLDRIKVLGLEVDEIKSSLKADYEKKVRFRKHAIGQEIFDLSNLYDLIIKFKSINNGSLIDDMIINPTTNTTIKDCFESMGQTISTVRKMVDSIAEDYFYGDDEQIDVLNFLEQYCNENSGVNFKMIFSHDYKIAEKDEYLPDIQEVLNSDEDLSELKILGYDLIAKAGDVIAPPRVNISAMSLRQILSNIRNNAIKHGFTSNERSDYKILVNVSSGANINNKGTVDISISNNGNPLKPGMNDNSFFINSRQGNIEIKDRVEHANGKISLETDANSEFPVKLVLTFIDESILHVY